MRNTMVVLPEDLPNSCHIAGRMYLCKYFPSSWRNVEPAGQTGSLVLLLYPARSMAINGMPRTVDMEAAEVLGVASKYREL